MRDVNTATLVCQKQGLNIQTNYDASACHILVFVQGQLAVRLQWKSASVFISARSCFIPYRHLSPSTVAFLDHHHSCAVVVNIVGPDGSSVTAQRRIYRRRIPVPRDFQPLPTGRLVVATLTQSDNIHKWLFTLPTQSKQSYYKVDVKFEQPACTVVSWFLHTTSNRKRRRWNQGTVSDEQTSESTFVATVPANRKATLECIVERTSLVTDTVRYTVTKRTVSVDGLDLAPTLPPPTQTPTPKQPLRKAIIVGISQYRKASVRPLEYCDEDAETWYRYLTERGYDCQIFGDEFNWYPRWDGPATVKNVRDSVTRAAAENEQGNRFVFVASGHGSGNGKGDSNLCLLSDIASSNKHEADGQYWDFELAADLSQKKNEGSNFLCFDTCFSGGLVEELIEAVPNICGTTTCTENGYGYDMSSLKHGAWTSQFLCHNLMNPISSLSNDLYDIFLRAATAYRRDHANKGDSPCFFGRCGGFRYNSKQIAQHAYGRFHLNELL